MIYTNNTVSVYQLINLSIQGTCTSIKNTSSSSYDTCVDLLWLIYHLYIEHFRFKINFPIHAPENHLHVHVYGICSQIVWGHLEVIIKQDC